MEATVQNTRFVVLAAVDDSDKSHDVVRVAANFARSIAGGELHLVHVVENLPPPVSVAPRPFGLGITTAEIFESARKRLAGLSAMASSEFGKPITTHLAAGSAWKQILQVAIDVQADMVAVGTHGRGGIKRMVLGSVAEMVVRKASCPVVVVREKDYHAFVPPEIEPACPDCLRVQGETGGGQLWCERHLQHPRGHITAIPPSASAPASAVRDHRPLPTK
jgi:nucleotide-binding universal stress UspA family protein